MNIPLTGETIAAVLATLVINRALEVLSNSNAELAPIVDGLSPIFT